MSDERGGEKVFIEVTGEMRMAAKSCQVSREHYAKFTTEENWRVLCSTKSHLANLVLKAIESKDTPCP